MQILPFLAPKAEDEILCNPSSPEQIGNDLSPAGRSLGFPYLTMSQCVHVHCRSVVQWAHLLSRPRTALFYTEVQKCEFLSFFLETVDRSKRLTVTQLQALVN